MLALEAHTDLCGHPYGSCVARGDKANETAYAKLQASIVCNRKRSLSSESLTPACFGNEEGQFYLKFAVNLPGQQATPSEKRTGTALDRSPKSQPRELGMAVLKPLEFPLGFLEGARTVWKVAPDLGITVQNEQRVEIAWLEVPKRKARSLQDDHDRTLDLAPNISS